MLDAPLDTDTDTAALGPWPSSPDPSPGPQSAESARLDCILDGARDPNLLVRLVAELARRSRVPDVLWSAPLPDQPDTQRVVLSVMLSCPREAAHLLQRFSSWPCVIRVRRGTIPAAPTP